MERSIFWQPLIGTLIPEAFQESRDNCLDAIQLIFMRTSEALNAFTLREFTKFDAVVGDQACQIRALKINLMALERLKCPMNEIADKLVDLDQCRQDLEKLNEAEKIEQEKLINESKEINKKKEEEVQSDKTKEQEIVEKYKTIFKEMKIRKNLCSAKYNNLRLTEAKKLEINVCSDVIFLVQAYLLTISTKNDVRKNQLFPEKLAIKGINFPSNIVNDVFLARTKKLLACQSVQFVQEQAKILRVPYEPLLTTRRILLEGRSERNELPFFYMTRVIFESAFKNKVPVLLKIRNKNPGIKFVFEKLYPDNSRKDVPGIVIEAYNNVDSQKFLSPEFARDLFKVGENIMNIIELNVAQHPQYTDEKGFEEIPQIATEEKERMNQKKAIAIQNGFSSKNSTWCCIDHIFSDLISRQMGGCDE